MSDAPQPPKLLTRCARCREPLAVAPERVGRRARCPRCGEIFEIRPAGGEPPVPGPAAATAGQVLCAVCQSPVAASEQSTACPQCRTLHHRDCWEYNRGCGMYGCPESPPTERLDSLEIPASYWGKEEKNCPMCNQVILAAAVRCRHCGATFASARPEDAVEFRSRTAVESSLPRARRATVWLLIFSVLPCAAPLAALVGAVWYAGHRQTVLILLFVLLYGAFRA
jgi:hypothetical protein